MPAKKKKTAAKSAAKKAAPAPKAREAKTTAAKKAPEKKAAPQKPAAKPPSYEGGKWAAAFAPRAPGERRYWLLKSEPSTFSLIPRRKPTLSSSGTEKGSVSCSDT